MSKKKRGRASKYDPKFCREIIEYFDIDPTYLGTVTIRRKDGSIEHVEKEFPNSLPTLAGFAKKIGVHRDTINQWTKDHKNFSDALKRAKECQEAILIDNGLKGLYEGPFAIFTAKNVLGWRDKQEITGEDGKPFSVQVIAGNGHNSGTGSK